MRIQTEMADADEFDTYFAEADVTAALQQAAADTRRGSLPPGGLLVPSSDRLPRRTASCKYPSVRRRSGHSPSPLAHLDPAPQYALEPTLRAPSPRPDARCRSAPQSRSSSWKNMKRPSSFRNLAADDDDDDDNRSGSVPFEVSRRGRRDVGGRVRRRGMRCCKRWGGGGGGGGGGEGERGRTLN